MKLRIESFTELTDWVINSPSVIALNEFEDCIAGIDNTTSLIARFDTSDTVRTLTKTFTAVDVTDYDTLTFSIWSEKKGKQQYGRNIATDFNYKIQINATDEYYLPVYTSFTEVNINIEDVTSIDRIIITALHSDTDNMIFSEMVAEVEEMPIDLLEEIKDHIEYYLTRNVGKGVLLGTVSASVGDSTINTGDYDYLDRYSVILIDDGANSETHQIAEVNDNTSKANLSDNFDGKTITSAHTDANLYLIFPVYINPDERTVNLPGIAVWGITPEPILRTGKLDRFIESYKTDGTMTERKEGQVWRYLILLDCEARSSHLISLMSKAIRDFGSNNFVWINGRKHELDFAGTPTESPPVQGIDIIPKLQYQLSVEVIEQRSPSETLVKTDTINTNINIGGI